MIAEILIRDPSVFSLASSRHKQELVRSDSVLHCPATVMARNSDEIPLVMTKFSAWGSISQLVLIL